MRRCRRWRREQRRDAGRRGELADVGVSERVQERERE